MGRLNPSPALAEAVNREAEIQTLISLHIKGMGLCHFPGSTWLFRLCLDLRDSILQAAWLHYEDKEGLYPRLTYEYCVITYPARLIPGGKKNGTLYIY